MEIPDIYKYKVLSVIILIPVFKVFSTVYRKALPLPVSFSQTDKLGITLGPNMTMTKTGTRDWNQILEIIKE